MSVSAERWSERVREHSSVSASRVLPLRVPFVKSGCVGRMARRGRMFMQEVQRKRLRRLTRTGLELWLGSPEAVLVTSRGLNVVCGSRAGLFANREGASHRA